jgi:hypothetical protein
MTNMVWYDPKIDKSEFRALLWKARHLACYEAGWNHQVVAVMEAEAPSSKDPFGARPRRAGLDLTRTNAKHHRRADRQARMRACVVAGVPGW